MKIEKTYSFKYNIVANGNKKGISSKPGLLTNIYLELDGNKIPFDLVVDTYARKKRIALTLSHPEKIDDSISKHVKDNNLVLEISEFDAVELEKIIDIKASSIFAKKNKERLEQEGKGDLFKTVICPSCSATIDLSGFKDTEFIHCRFCDSLVNKNLKIISDRETFQHCDECGLYNIIQEYTIFYFYFLLIIYGFQHQKRRLCGNCALRIGKNALLLNLFFIIGIPSALNVLSRAKDISKPGDKELREANNYVLKGDYHKADSIFDKLNEIFPNHPGVLYNQASAHFNGGDSKKGVEFLLESIKHCANYDPSLLLIHNINQQLKQVQVQSSES